jgi:hypothetical protein
MVITLLLERVQMHQEELEECAMVDAEQQEQIDQLSKRIDGLMAMVASLGKKQNN